MNVAIVGGSALGLAAARVLLSRKLNVVIVEKDKRKIDEVSEDLDCGFLHGDGSRPGILKEVGPDKIDVLLCLTDDDQANLLSALVGRSLGFGRVIPKIRDVELEQICAELGLSDTIIPDRTIAGHLADIVEGGSNMDLSATIKGDARLLSFRIHDDGPSSADDLDLPDKTAVVCIFREDDFFFPEEDLTFEEGDQVTIITHAEHLPSLQDKWAKVEETKDKP